MCIGLRFKTPGARARATGRGKEPRGQLARPERGQGVGGIPGAEEGRLEACLRKSMQAAKFTLTEESGEAASLPDPGHLARARDAVRGARARRPRGPASRSSPPGRPVPESPARRFPGRRVRARRPPGWRCSGSRAEQVTDPLPPRPTAGSLRPTPAEPPAKLSEPSSVARFLSLGPCPARASLLGSGVGNVGGPSGRFHLQSAAW